jgi:tRNA-dihydrouridine synthase
MLAPIEDCTDTALRTLCFNHGADLTFTEFARIDGLAKKNKETWKLIELKNSTPTQIQILPDKVGKLEQFLKIFKPTEGFKGFNLNYGCPDPNVVAAGRGCAMIKDVSKTDKMVELIKRFNYPVSIKMRLGATNLEKSNKVYLDLVKETNPDFFIVHARSGEQNYSIAPDYSVFEELVQTGKDIIANGNIDTISRVNELKQIGVNGVMIGREAVRNPAIFDLLKGKSSPSFESLKLEYTELAKKYGSLPRSQKKVLMRIGEQKN